MKAKLINNITGEIIDVIETTDHPDSSYGRAVWVDNNNVAYTQVGMESPFYRVIQEEDN